MAYVSSTYTDPSDTFVWWIEGDRLAIATIEGDANTSETGRGTIDIDNVLQPALIDFVKGKALMDAAARATDPGLAQIKMASAQQCMANYKEAIRRYGMKKNDKVGGTRAVVPADLR